MMASALHAAARRVRPAFLAVAASAGALSACTVDAFTYTTGRYGTTAVRHVHLGCSGDTYEVFDRPEPGTMLVRTNGFNEGLAGLCGGTTESLPRPERMRRVARIFLDETTNRPDCRVVSENEVTGQHTEFVYRCGPDRRQVVAPARPPREDGPGRAR